MGRRHNAVQINILLDPQRAEALQRMADEAAVPRSTMARRIVESVIDDDAKAHAAKASA